MDVLRLFAQDVSIDGQGLGLAVVGHEHIGIAGLVVQVVGILVGEGFHLADGFFGASQLVVEVAFCVRQLLALAVNLLHERQLLNGLLIVFFAHIEPIEHLEQVFALLVGGIEPLIDVDGGRILTHLYVRLSQNLLVVGIVGLQLGRFLEIALGHVFLLYLLVVVGQEVVGLGCFGIELYAAAQEVERGVGIVLIALRKCFVEEHVVAAHALIVVGVAQRARQQPHRQH